MKVLKDLAVSDTGFIFNPESGESYTVNELGLIILNELRKEKNQSEIIRRIITEYDVTEIEIEKDFSDFVKMIKFYNLMTD